MAATAASLLRQKGLAKVCVLLLFSNFSVVVVVVVFFFFFFLFSMPRSVSYHTSLSSREHDSHHAFLMHKFLHYVLRTTEPLCQSCAGMKVLNYSLYTALRRNAQFHKEAQYLQLCASQFARSVLFAYSHCLFSTLSHRPIQTAVNRRKRWPLWVRSIWTCLEWIPSSIGIGKHSAI